MRTPIFCLCALAALPALAGTRIQMQSTELSSGESRKTLVLLDATRLRVDSGNGSLIFLTDGGRKRVLMLDRQRGEYSEMDRQAIEQLGRQLEGMAAQMDAALAGLPAEQRAAMEQMMKGQMGQAAPAAPERTVYTARGTDSVGGVSCTRYDGMRGGKKVAEVCAADPAALGLGAADQKLFDELRDLMAELAGAMQRLPFAAAADASVADPGFEGFPVSQTSFRDGKGVRREQLEKFGAADFSDGDFSTGEARRIEMGR